MGLIKSIVVSKKSDSSRFGPMQSTGHASTHAVSFTSIHGSAITNATIRSFPASAALTQLNGSDYAPTQRIGVLPRCAKRRRATTPRDLVRNLDRRVVDLRIVVGFMRHHGNLREVVRKRWRLNLPLQPRRPPRIRTRHLPILQ